MAILATKFDSDTIDNYTIRWKEDLTGAQRAHIATETERERFVPEFAWLKVGQLYVDETYQRPLSNERVWDIATRFTWSLFEPLWVGLRGGKHYVVDGRHRLAAASILGVDLIDELPCSVRRTQSVEEEARIFVELQERRRTITSAQRFKAKLLYKDPEALAIAGVMNRYGFTVNSDIFGNKGNRTEQSEISAIGTLEAIYRAGGKSRVDGVLLIIRDAWDGVAPTTSSWMLRAVSRMLEREPGKDPVRLAKRLRDKDPWGLIERGQRFAHSNGIPLPEAMSDVLLKVTE